MAKERGNGVVVTGVLLACILAGDPGGVDGITDQTDGEWFRRFFSSFPFSFLFGEKKYLENNQFTGQIDVLANLPLQDL
ncbi:hypothetical protein BHE74_00058011 [Ensete ventricosum]|nr:hypothetical protein BHE74_00058011 [Ensete ventricosum]